MYRSKFVIGALILALAATLVGANWWFRRDRSPRVTAEIVQTRDLEALVSASGKIQPKRSVDISANTVGQVTRVAVNEGDKVRRGQFLLQIDARTLRTAVERSEAGVLAARSGLETSRVAVETAQANLDRARRDLKRQQDLWRDELTTREALERAENDLRVRETELKARQQDVTTSEQQIKQEAASLESNRYELTKVTLESPIDGIVTRRNIDEGETVVMGTMNNAGTVLMTIADMSVVQAEIEVDETDIPNVAIGQPAKVSIDAIPGRTFKGHVAEIGNSPIQSTTTSQTSTTASQATNFKVVIVLDDAVPVSTRPGFTSTADITTAVRQRAIAVPIQAVTVRELVYDEAGRIVRQPPRPRARTSAPVEPTVAAQPLSPGQTRKETEGVFAFRGGKAEFVPITVGIAGERYFEVLSGLHEGDEIITGPYTSVRQIADGDRVKLDQSTDDSNMPFLEAVSVALESIWANKLRSLLTVLGNIVAVGAISTVVSLIQGLNTYVTDTIVTNVGADSFTVERTGIVRSDQDAEKVRGNPLITLRDGDAIRRYSPIVSAVVAQASRNAAVSYGQHILESVRVQGVTRELAQFSLFDAERGRLPSPLEVDRSQPVVLLGWETADRLFSDTDPLEKTVKISRVHFRVVGVSKKKGSAFGQSLDEFAVIPLGAYQKLFGARQSLALMVKPRDPSRITSAIEDATIALRIERRLKPAEDSNFGVFTSDTILGIYHQATTGIYTVLLGVVALSLVVGGIVIMNIMLMVVTERTHEIGLRKALGARRRDIVWQVLTESVTLSTFGGVVGTALGFLAALAISHVTPVPAAIQPWAVALGVSVTAAVGLFFGLYPAMRAASLDPIEALRHE